MGTYESGLTLHVRNKRKDNKDKSVHILPYSMFVCLHTACVVVKACRLIRL